MLLYPTNPDNPFISLASAGRNRWNRYRVRKPLVLWVLARLTPRERKIQIIDKNRGGPDDSSLPLPGPVGITASTSQAHRLAAERRGLGPGGEEK